MQKDFDINEDGHSIRCIEYFNGDIKKADHWVVATHGFGGNKENSAVKKFAERIISKYHGYGVVCFDWPCHGKDARNQLILSECLEYLDHVNRFVRLKRGADKIYNYSVSLGAYLTLLYIHEYDDPYEKIALRSPAVKMYSIMYAGLSDDEKRELEKKGKIKLAAGHSSGGNSFTAGKRDAHINKSSSGNKTGSAQKTVSRKITITSDFMNDLKKNDITKYEYFDDAERMIIIHGTKDRTVPIEYSREFADDNVIELTAVENADHPFTNPEYMDLAIQKIIEFFAPEI